MPLNKAALADTHADLLRTANNAADADFLDTCHEVIDAADGKHAQGNHSGRA